MQPPLQVACVCNILNICFPRLCLLFLFLSSFLRFPFFLSYSYSFINEFHFPVYQASIAWHTRHGALVTFLDFIVGVEWKERMPPSPLAAKGKPSYDRGKFAFFTHIWFYSGNITCTIPLYSYMAPAAWSRFYSTGGRHDYAHSLY